MSGETAIVDREAGAKGDGGAYRVRSSSDRNHDGSSPGCAKGVILAGEHPWRGDVLDGRFPRSLWPIVGRPVICHVLTWLRDAGVSDVSICANSQTDVMQKHLGGDAAAGLKIDYVEDVAPRGPAGCVRDAAGTSAWELVVAVEGSVVPRVDLRELLSAHRRSGAALTVVVGRNVPTVGGGDSLQPAGLYVFSKVALGYIPPTGYQDIKEILIPRLNSQGETVMSYVSEEPVARIADMKSYLTVNAWLLEEAVGSSRTLEGYRRVGEALIHRTAALSSTARLIGPVLVGANSTVGEGVSVVGPTTIGVRCTLRRDAMVCRSSIWDECRIGTGGLLDRCVLTDGAHVEEWSVCRDAVIHEARRPTRWPRFMGGRMQRARTTGAGAPMSGL